MDEILREFHREEEEEEDEDNPMRGFANADQWLHYEWGSTRNRGEPDLLNDDWWLICTCTCVRHK